MPYMITPPSSRRSVSRYVTPTNIRRMQTAVKLGMKAGQFIKDQYSGRPSGPFGSGPLYKKKAPTARKLFATRTSYKQKPVYGRYAGRFKRGTRRNTQSMAAKLGCVLSNENYGSCTDADLVYIAHNTFAAGKVALAISCAILRKLFKKALNYDASAINQVIPTRSDLASGGLVSFIFRNPVDDARTVISHTLANNDTIESVSNSFIGIITQIMNGTTYLDLKSVTFSTYSDGGTIAHVIADINMENEVLKLNLKSVLKVQNRTLGATSGSSEDDVVDAQPLVGKVIEFRGGCIKLKNNDVQNAVHFRIRDTGILLLPGSNLKTGQLEPRQKHDFSNAYKQSKFLLQPGDIKTGYIKSSHAAYFNNIFKAFKYSKQTVSLVDYQTAAPGKVQLISFEEQLNSGSANLIKVQYEQQQYVEAYLVTGKKPTITTFHTQAAISS